MLGWSTVVEVVKEVVVSNIDEDLRASRVWSVQQSHIPFMLARVNLFQTASECIADHITYLPVFAMLRVPGMFEISPANSSGMLPPQQIQKKCKGHGGADS